VLTTMAVFEHASMHPRRSVLPADCHQRLPQFLIEHHGGKAAIRAHPAARVPDLATARSRRRYVTDSLSIVQVWGSAWVRMQYPLLPPTCRGCHPGGVDDRCRVRAHFEVSVLPSMRWAVLTWAKRAASQRTGKRFVLQPKGRSRPKAGNAWSVGGPLVIRNPLPRRHTAALGEAAGFQPSEKPQRRTATRAPSRSRRPAGSLGRPARRRGPRIGLRSRNRRRRGSLGRPDRRRGRCPGLRSRSCRWRHSRRRPART
jgi:hypothetical protein